MSGLNITQEMLDEVREVSARPFEHEKEKRVLVPQSDIDKLEEARKDLWAILAEHPAIAVLTMDITKKMFHITHRRYEEEI